MSRSLRKEPKNSYIFKISLIIQKKHQQLKKRNGLFQKQSVFPSVEDIGYPYRYKKYPRGVGALYRNFRTSRGGVDDPKKDVLNRGATDFFWKSAIKEKKNRTYFDKLKTATNFLPRLFPSLNPSAKSRTSAINSLFGFDMTTGRNNCFRLSGNF